MAKELFRVIQHDPAWDAATVDKRFQELAEDLKGLEFPNQRLFRQCLALIRAGFVIGWMAHRELGEPDWLHQNDIEL